MGMPTAQAGQPISQQQPATSNNTVVDSVVSGTPQQVNSSQNLGQLLGNGKGSSQMTQSPHPIGKGSTTNSTTSGQPQIGRPNTYSNTVGPWDNSNTQPQVQSGKGKGH